MYLILDRITLEIWHFEDQDEAKEKAVALNQASENHSVFKLYEITGKDSKAEYKGDLYRPFGHDEFYWRREV